MPNFVGKLLSACYCMFLKSSGGFPMDSPLPNVPCQMWMKPFSNCSLNSGESFPSPASQYELDPFFTYSGLSLWALCIFSAVSSHGNGSFDMSRLPSFNCFNKKGRRPGRPGSPLTCWLRLTLLLLWPSLLAYRSLADPQAQA